MSCVSVNTMEAKININGDLLEEYINACLSAARRMNSSNPSYILTRLIENFIAEEHTRDLAREGKISFRDFSMRRSRELWLEMSHQIDYENLPTGGPNGIYKQEEYLEHEIERIVEEEWEDLTE